MNNRLDLNKVDDSGIKRLIEAILLRTVRDWMEYSRKINKKGRNEKYIRELKQILSFIKSDHFVRLTNASVPQKETINKFISTIKNKKIREELINYCSLKN